MSQYLLYYNSESDYQTNEGGGSPSPSPSIPAYVLQKEWSLLTRINLLPGNQMEVMIDWQPSGTTPFLGSGYYVIEENSWTPNFQERLGFYERKKNMDLPSGITCYDEEDTEQTGATFTTSSPLLCVSHNGTKYYGENNGEGEDQEIIYSLSYKENSKNPGTLIYLYRNLHVRFLIEPKNYMKPGVISVYPGVAFIEETSRVAYNGNSLPEFDFPRNEVDYNQIILNWSDCGMTEGVFNQYAALIDKNDALLESYNIKCAGEYPDSVCFSEERIGDTAYQNVPTFRCPGENSWEQWKVSVFPPEAGKITITFDGAE